MAKGKMLRWIAKLLVIVGAINWGLVGLGGLMNKSWDVVMKILSYLGAAAWVWNIIYVLVGLSALYLIMQDKKKVLQ